MTGSRSWGSTSAATSTGREAPSCSSNPARNRFSVSGNGFGPTCVPCTARTRPRWCSGSTPVVRGWSAFYRSVVSSRVFTGLDHYVWHITYRWARRSHPNKSRIWVATRYFGLFNKSRRDRWVFGDRVSGAYLTKFSWTKIVRHVPVRGRASPDDPALDEYWAVRRRQRKAPPVDEHTARLLRAQGGRCPSCGEFLLHADREPRSPLEWEQWFITVRRVLRKQHIVEQVDGHDRTFYRLLHAHCQRRLTTTQDNQP